MKGRAIAVACLAWLAVATVAMAQFDHVAQYVKQCKHHPEPKQPRHFCVIGPEQQAYCWGENANGQLGRGGIQTDWRPGRVAGLPKASAVAIGEMRTFAIAQGELYSWGSDQSGGLGLPSAKRSQFDPARPGEWRVYGAPQRTGLRNVRSVSGRGGLACAVTAGIPQATGVKSGETGGGYAPSELYCWGSSAQLPDIGFAEGLGDCTRPWEDIVQCFRPTKMAPKGAVAVEVGEHNGCLLQASGELRCWGWVLEVAAEPTSKPHGVWRTKITDAVAFSLGEWSVCAISKAGRLSCWRHVKAEGGGGDGHDPERQDMGLEHVTQVSGEWASGCAVTAAHELYCWGDNVWSQLGMGKNWRNGKGCVVEENRCQALRVEACRVPQRVPLNNVAAVQVVGSSVVATTLDGAIYQWGAMRGRHGFEEVDTPRRLPLP